MYNPDMFPATGSFFLLEGWLLGGFASEMRHVSIIQASPLLIPGRRRANSQVVHVSNKTVAPVFQDNFSLSRPCAGSWEMLLGFPVSWLSF